MRIRFLRRPSGGGVCWWLDLDNTLHNASRHILPEIDRQMTRYVADHLGLPEPEASQVRTHYWLRYGATLLGMVRHHGTDPADFLEKTHQLPDLQRQVQRDPRMRNLLKRLPGHRILLTNAPLAYALRVVDHLGIRQSLHGIVAIDDMWIHGALRPKPADLLWSGLRRQVPARRHVLFEDTLGHLKAVRPQRMQTAWIAPALSKSQRGPGRPAYVDRKTRHFAQMGAWALRVAQTGQASSRRTLMR